MYYVLALIHGIDLITNSLQHLISTLTVSRERNQFVLVVILLLADRVIDCYLRIRQC